MELSATQAAGNNVVGHSSDHSSTSRVHTGGENWTFENPFSFKVLQVFTGFGVGCGVGIGIGRPIYLGAIPALQQVFSATRGAMDVFSGAGRHVNANLRKYGVKNVEVGIGCGVGIGHGFGVGIALKPGVIQRIQTCFGQAMAKIMMNIGTMPGLSTLQSTTPDSGHSSTDALNRYYSGKIGTSVGNVLQLTNKSTEITSLGQESARNPSINSTHGSLELKATSSELPLVTHSERVISHFLQNPIFKNEEEVELSEIVGKLRSENGMLQMLLKHQKVIEELIEENERLRQILVEDLRVPPSKLRTSNFTWRRSMYPCSDCIECRRKQRSLR